MRGTSGHGRYTPGVRWGEAWGALVAIALAAPSGLVHAQDAGTCDPPRERRWETSFPADGSSGATIDTPIRVRYTEGFFDDPAVRAMAPSMITVRLDDDAGAPIDPPIAG